ncbi:MAG: hypothetical protein MJ126_10650 [Lachnospiraceae bacterium]|nr:hypothetical protein [Lachnospiraceae bacterium]
MYYVFKDICIKFTKELRNSADAKNAIKSGFTPAWVEMTVTPGEVVEEMNI